MVGCFSVFFNKQTASNKRQHTPENAPLKRFTGHNRSPVVPFSPSSFSPARYEMDDVTDVTINLIL